MTTLLQPGNPASGISRRGEGHYRTDDGQWEINKRYRPADGWQVCDRRPDWLGGFKSTIHKPENAPCFATLREAKLYVAAFYAVRAKGGE